MRVSSPTFVGRRDELASLADSLRRARLDGPRMVTVGGEAGIGKTRLMGALADHARAAGVRVLTGGCLDIADGTPPLGAISEALRPLWAEFDTATMTTVVGPAGPSLASLGLTRADPDAGPAGGGPGQILEQLRGVFERLAEAAPILLVIEDVHWAERSTRDLLVYLIRNLRQPALIVATYRAEELRRRPELRQLLAELHRNRRCEHVALGPLARAEVSEMLGEIVGFAAPMDLVGEIVSRAEGNPFFAEELLAAHRRGGKLPATLRTVLAARTDRLPAGGHPLLGLLATLGGPAPHDLLAALFAGDAETLIELLRVAVDEDVLRIAGDGRSYTFRHALLREWVYSELLPGERQQFHQRCAQTLSERPEPPAAAARSAQLGAIAFHWHRSGNAAQALLASARAGAAAEVASSPADATRHYQRILDLWDQAPDAASACGIDHDTLVRRAAGTAHLCGDYDTAVRLLTDALEAIGASGNPACASEFAESIGYCQLARGDLDGAERSYRAAAHAAPPDGPGPELARALTGQGHVLLIRDRNAPAIQAARAALAAATAIDGPGLTCRPLTVLGSALCTIGQLDEGLSTLEQATAASEAGGDASTLIWALGATADARMLAGQPAAVIPLARKALAVARTLGAASNYGVWFATAAAEALLGQGELSAAGTELDGLLALDPPIGVRRRPLVALGYLHLARGSIDQSAQAADQALAPAIAQFSAALVADACALGARVAAAQGRYDDARRTIAAGLAGRAGTDGPAGVIRLCCAGLAAEADRHCHLGDLGLTDDLAETTAIARRWIATARDAGSAARQFLLSRAELATGEAQFLRIAGDLHEQVDSWQAATDRWDDIGFTCPATSARVRWATALLGAGAVADASSILRAAHTDAVRIGAATLARQAAELARHARIELPAAGRRIAETGHLPGALTDREEQVLALLARGMTNRSISRALFISEKTVSVHVTHILAKLHVHNRGQAAAIGRRPTATPPR